MILYYARTACSIAPHIALEEVGADFEARRVDLAAGEQNSPQYLAVNPAGRVPVLIVRDRVVTEVPALLTFIASLNPAAELVPPAGSLSLARCFEWLGFLSSSLHVAYAQFRRPSRFVGDSFGCTEAFIDHGRENTIAFYREVERRLDSGWAAGDIYSIADMYLLPFHGWAWRLDFDVTKECPKWTALVERMSQRPAVRRVFDRENSDGEIQDATASAAR